MFYILDYFFKDFIDYFFKDFLGYGDEQGNESRRY